MDKKGKLLKRKAGRYSNQIGLLIVIAALSFLFVILNPAFIMPDNLMNIVRQASVNIIMAMGVTFVMVSGNIDLSIGGIASLTGMSVAMMLTKGIATPIAIICGLAIGALIGFINGFVTARFKLPSMIVTLAMMNITNGVASLLTGGTAIYGLPESFAFLGRGYVLGFIPFQVVLMFIVVVIAAVVLAKCLFGRYAYAIGGNETVTRLAGVKIFRYKVLYFVVCGICAGGAGMILTSRLMTGQPTLAADSMMDIMTAVVIGGAGLAGSSGSVGGSFLGALLLTIVANGLTINGVNSFWQGIITAIILLIVIIVRKDK